MKYWFGYLTAGILAALTIDQLRPVPNKILIVAVFFGLICAVLTVTFIRLINRLIRQGVLADDDPEIMAAQFCLPISVWINLCDREPNRETEVMELVDKHIRQFFRLYQRSGR